MPNIKSAKKRVKVTCTKTLQNKIFKSKLRTALRKVVDAKSPQEKKDSFYCAISLLDRAAKKNILHKNNVARKKSSLSKLVANLS